MQETITVIGSGRMGGAFAKRLSELGYSVALASREPQSESVQSLIADIDNCTAVAISSIPENSNIIVFAVPYSGFDLVFESLGPLDGKIILDCSNALKMSDDGLMTMASDLSSGEELQIRFPDANIIKAFNTIGYHIVANPNAAPGKVTTLLAGNNADAKNRIAALTKELGFETVNVGPIRQSRYLEGMSALYLTPYLQGRVEDAFEYYLRQGTSSKEKTARAAS